MPHCQNQPRLVSQAQSTQTIAHLPKWLSQTAVLVVIMSLFSTSVAFAADKLVIISPHRKSIQNEYVPSFKDWYKSKYGTEIDVEWLDQGGSNDDVKFIKSKFASGKTTSGIDVFFGGGTTAHTEVAMAGHSAPFKLPPALEKQIPPMAAGLSLTNKDKTFIAQALSSFGIFYNKTLLKIEKTPEPITWESLGDTRYLGKLVLTDPRKSGTYSVSNHIILETSGWEKGIELLSRMAGNTKKFTQSSSDPIKAVVAGDAVATTAIDFYALAKIGDLGQDKLGFVLPEGKTVIEGDPVTILKGAPNRQAADRFLEYILSVEGQKLLVLPKGAPGGPKNETLGRLAVNSEVYKVTEGQRVNKLNPFTAKGFVKYDSEKTAKIRKVFDDLMGATMIDTHREMKSAWERVVAKGAKPEDVKAFVALPITQAELTTLSSKWDDAVFRNQKINDWVKFAKKKYETVAK